MRSRKVFLFIPVSGMLSPLAAPAAEPWIERSDRNSAIVIEMQGAFYPEFTSEIALGPRFEQRKFHDFVIEQGLLPPKLLERALMQEIEGMR